MEKEASSDVLENLSRVWLLKYIALDKTHSIVHVFFRDGLDFDSS
jgi:hypothetical protein